MTNLNFDYGQGDGPRYQGPQQRAAPRLLLPPQLRLGTRPQESSRRPVIALSEQGRGHLRAQHGPGVFFWRRLLVVGVLAGAVAAGWGAMDKLLASAVPSKASAIACESPAAPCMPARHAITYVARPGDTIWAIAVRFSGSKDPRPLEYHLEQEIGGGTLQPGQVLDVP